MLARRVVRLKGLAIGGVEITGRSAGRGQEWSAASENGTLRGCSLSSDIQIERKIGWRGRDIPRKTQLRCNWDNPPCIHSRFCGGFRDLFNDS